MNRDLEAISIQFPIDVLTFLTDGFQGQFGDFTIPVRRFLRVRCC
jgi:hypothetical protein